MKLSNTEKILGIIILVLFIALVTLVVESVAAERPDEAWVVERLQRDYGFLGNLDRNELWNEYDTLCEVWTLIYNARSAAIENGDIERIKALIIAMDRFETALTDFLIRAETFIKTNKGI